MPDVGHREMASKAYPTFQIIDFPDEGSVVGRNCGSDVPLGNVFTRIVRQDFTGLASDGFKMKETVLADGLAIELVEIEMYRRTFDLLASGYVATLALSGSDVKKLYSLRSVLGDHTYLAIETPPGAQQKGRPDW
jgi:hypothetical protein